MIVYIDGKCVEGSTIEIIERVAVRCSTIRRTKDTIFSHRFQFTLLCTQNDPGKGSRNSRLRYYIPKKIQKSSLFVLNDRNKNTSLFLEIVHNTNRKLARTIPESSTINTFINTHRDEYYSNYYTGKYTEIDSCRLLIGRQRIIRSCNSVAKGRVVSPR